MFEYFKTGLTDYSHYIRLSDEIPKVKGLSISTSKTDDSSRTDKKPVPDVKGKIENDKAEEKVLPYA